MLKVRVDTTKIKIKDVTKSTPLLNEHADIIETAYLMYNSDITFLPVVRNKEIIGVLDGLSLIHLAVQLPELDHFKIKDVRLTNSIGIGKDDTIAKVLEMMYMKKLEQVPLLEQGKIFGVISYSDILKKYFTWSPQRESSKKMGKILKTRSAQVDSSNLSSLPAISFSTNDNVISLSKDASLKEAVNLMVKNNLYNLLITKEGDFDGILTIKNILRVIGSFEIPQNFNIKFIGLKEAHLDTNQRYNIKKIVSNEAFKLQRDIKDEFGLTLHLKEYDKGGKRHKYSVHLKLESPGHILTGEQAHWHLETALRKTFQNLKNNVTKKIRN